MSYAKFQENFEKEGEKWPKKYDLMDEDQLLNLIKKGKWDLTYQIWFAIRIKGTVEKSAPVFCRIHHSLEGKGLETPLNYQIQRH